MLQGGAMRALARTTMMTSRATTTTTATTATAGVRRGLLSTFAGQQKAPSEVRKMRFTEVLMDRYQPEVRDADQGFSLLSRGGRAKKRFQFGSMVKSFRAKSLATRSLKKHTEQSFIAEVQLVYQEFNAALATGALTSMRDVATEFIMDRLDRNMEYDSLVGTERLSRVVSFLKPPELLQARILGMHKQAKDLNFAQFTVRFVTENRRVLPGEFKNSAAASRSRGKHRIKKSNQFSRRPAERSMPDREPGRWAVAFDEKGEYYYNTVTKETRWDRPQQYLLSPTYTLCGNGTLGATGRVLDEDPKTGLDQVQIDVVFERPLFNTAVPWRVAFF